MPLLNSYANITTADGTEEFVVAHASVTKNVTAAVLKTYMGGGLALDATAKTTGFTAVAGNRYLLDTTTAGFTMTLPITPTVGDQVAFVDFGQTFQTSNLTIARNGQEIMNLAEDLVCNVKNFAGVLLFTGATKGWVLT